MAARCRAMPSVLHQGRTKAAALPSRGQIAPKMYVDAVRWSFGAEGRVPRRAQRRVILFFWPILASSPNQTSIRSRFDPLVARDRIQALGERFLKASTAPAAWA